jgi:hypothetical protein
VQDTNKYSEKSMTIYSDLKKTEDCHEEYYYYEDEPRQNILIYFQKRYSN